MLKITNLFRSGSRNFQLLNFQYFNSSKITNTTRSFSSKFPFPTLLHSSPTSQYFWSGYPELPNYKQSRIKRLECETFNPDQVEGALNKASIAANEQLLRYEKLKVVIETDNIFLKLFDKFLSFLSPPDFQDLTIPKIQIDQMNIKLKLIDHPLTAAAYSNGKRFQMEDTFVVTEFSVIIGKEQKIVSLTGVFDGHGGKECANFVSENIERILKLHLKFYNEDELTDAGIWNALTMSFVHLGQEFNPDSSHDFNPNAGTTANIVMIIDQDLWIANAGDSRAIVLDNKGKILATSESTFLEDAEYHQRVIDRFGVIEEKDLIPRIQGYLSVGGAIGNYWANGALSARPTIVKVVGENVQNATVIQCSDGVLDVATPSEIAKRFTKLKEKGRSLSEIAEDLAAASLAAGTTDNVTMMIHPITQLG